MKNGQNLQSDGSMSFWNGAFVRIGCGRIGYCYWIKKGIDIPSDFQ